jgi:hypothetical protein
MSGKLDSNLWVLTALSEGLPQSPEAETLSAEKECWLAAGITEDVPEAATLQRRGASPHEYCKIPQNITYILFANLTSPYHRNSSHTSS